MKKITILLSIVFGSQLQAQEADADFTAGVDQRLAQLNKDSITSGILIDRVFPIAGIQIFNQGSRKDTSSFAHFKQAWSELYRASYRKDFTSTEQLLSASRSLPDTIAIGLINTEFDQTDFGTTKENAKVNFDPTTGLFLYKTGINPFTKKQTTIISPLVEEVTKSTLVFKMDTLFRLHKQGKPIKTLKLFTNDQSFTLISDSKLQSGYFSTSYSSSGVKVWRFEITYSDNTTKTTYARIAITLPKKAARGRIAEGPFENGGIWADDDLTFEGYNESKAHKGYNEYRIYYDTKNNNRVLDKPLIIIDGFDPGDPRKIDKDDEGHTAEKSIYELMQYDHDNNPNTKKEDLVKTLRSRGYDVVIVNHPVYKTGRATIFGRKTVDGGSDYIERNAFVLISLIRKLKRQQQGNEKMVVVGPSMGGLISRYALVHMEKKLAENPNNTAWKAKWDHRTRLWISFDSPHQGANIPIGLQYNIDFFAGKLGVETAREFLDRGLNTPAAKQMLVHHYTADSEYPKGASGFRDRFQNSLNSMGFPQKLRKIALVNGSSSRKLNGTPGGLITYNNIKLNGVVFPFFIIPATLFADKLEFIVHNMPDWGIGEVFRGGIKGRFLWWEYYTKHKTIKHGRSYGNVGSYDTAPGGFFNAQREFQDAVENSENEIKISTIVPVILQLINWMGRKNLNIIEWSHNFILTKSALAYSGYRELLRENLNDRDLVCAGDTPFDSYFAPDHNEEHITLTAANVPWLLKEIEGDNQPPSYPLQEYLIKGPNVVCAGRIGTYTLNNCAVPESTSVTWNVSSHFSVINRSRTHITVRGESSGSGSIGFSLSNGQSQYKTVRVGHGGVKYGDLKIYYNGEDGKVDPDDWSPFKEYIRFFHFNLAHRDDWSDLGTRMINYSWEVYSFRNELSKRDFRIKHAPTHFSYGWSVDINKHSYSNCRGGDYYLVLRIETECYELCYVGFFFIKKSYLNTKPYRYNAYPNPAGSYLNINAKTTDTKGFNTYHTATDMAFLYDFKGVLVKSMALGDDTNHMDLLGLKSGNYILVIKRGDTKETHHIRIR